MSMGLNEVMMLYAIIFIVLVTEKLMLKKMFLIG